MAQQTLDQKALDFMSDIRARWLSTLAYQTIDITILDAAYWLRPARMARFRRETHGPDVTFLSLNDHLTAAKGDEKQKPVTAGQSAMQYRSLPSPDSIRLLHLRPGSTDSPIEVSLSTHSLENVPAYEALSYTWGSSSKVPIMCDSCSTQIQESLFQALKSLRRLDTERVLWADAICINQDDVREKTSQVQLMRRIYQSSVSVVVWIGDRDQNSDQGIDLIQSIQRLALLDGNITAPSAQPLGPEDLQRLGLPPGYSGKWKSLNATFWRPWFTRIWIVQELAVSKDATVVCGDRAFKWTELAHAAHFVLQHSLTAITGVDPRRPTKLETFRQEYVLQKGRLPLLPLLLRARDAFSTDDRDKIFALIGLSEQEVSGFSPDYSRTTEEVYVHFARCHIENTGSLDVLSAVEDHSYRLKQQLPSWVPDWEVHAPSTPLSLLDQHLSWNASKGSESKISVDFRDASKTLVTKGIILDSVLYIGLPFAEFSPLPGNVWLQSPNKFRREVIRPFLGDFWSRDRCRQWERIARNAERGSRYKGNLSAFVQTVTADAAIIDPNSSSPGASSNMLEAYNAWRSYWSNASEGQGQNISDSYTFTAPARLDLAVRFMQAHHQAAYGRRFFTSKSHGFMGLCPYMTRREDQLVVLSGGKTPFILRRLGHNRWKFIGECYVHGLMHGEGFRRDDSARREAKIEDFHIA